MSADKLRDLIERLENMHVNGQNSSAINEVIEAVVLLLSCELDRVEDEE